MNIQKRKKQQGKHNQDTQNHEKRRRNTPSKNKDKREKEYNNALWERIGVVQARKRSRNGNAK